MASPAELLPSLAAIIGPLALGTTFLKIKGATKIRSSLETQQPIRNAPGIATYPSKRDKGATIIEIGTGAKASVEAKNPHGLVTFVLENIRQGTTGRPFTLIRINDQEKPIALQSGRSRDIRVPVRDMYVTVRHEHHSDTHGRPRRRKGGRHR